MTVLDKEYGIPSQRKFPLDSEAHVRSAIKFFNYADPSHREELAHAIIRKIEQYGIDDLEPSDQNSFYKYYNPGELKHYGIKGMHWGVRRYQNIDGSLTAAGKARYVFDSARSKVGSAISSGKQYYDAFTQKHPETAKVVKTTVDGVLIVGGITLAASIGGTMGVATYNYLRAIAAPYMSKAVDTITEKLEYSDSQGHVKTVSPVDKSYYVDSKGHKHSLTTMSITTNVHR